MAIEMIKLNLIPDGKPPVIHCKQFDVAREFRVCVFEGSKPYIFTNETVELDVRKKDTTLVSVDLEVESGKHYIDVTTTEQMCTLTGKHEAEIRIYSDALHTQEIGSLSFFIQVTKSVVNGGLVSESEVTNLQRQVHDQVVIELRDHGAEDTGYNNAYSGLDATNVQSAIDEVNDKVDNIPTIDAYTKEEADDKFATKNDLTANNVSFNNEDTDLEATNTEDAIKEVDSKVNEKADTSSLAEVATSGSYNDLTDKPTIPEQVQSDWNEEDNTKPDYIKNKPDLSKVATSGNYNDLSNKPTIPAPQVNSDWNADSGVSQILNKPNFATVATSGNYNDLSNKPSIPAAQVNSDWNADSGVSQILNKPNLSTVATTGDYNDLDNKPSVAVIDDTQASASKAYSSNKVVDLLDDKANASEVENIRIGVDGTTYASAGDAVRGQIQDVNDEILDVYAPSLTWEDGKYIGTNGSLVSNVNYSVARYINANGYKKIKVNFDYNNIYIASVCFYKQTNETTYVKVGDALTNVTANAYINIPADATAIGITRTTTEKSNAVIKLYNSKLSTIDEDINELNGNLSQFIYDENQTLTWTNGKYIMPSGAVGNSGTMSISNFIDVSNSESITFNMDKASTQYTAPIAFYKSNDVTLNYLTGNIVGVAEFTSGIPLAIPKGANYALLGIVTADTTFIKAVLKKSDKIIRLNGLSTKNEVGVVFGDSIIEGVGVLSSNGNVPTCDVVSNMKRMTGASIFNAGIGGTYMSQTSGANFCDMVDAIISGDWSDVDVYISNLISQNTEFTGLLTTIGAIKTLNFSTVDYVIIAYGTNDWAGNVPMGDDTSTSKSEFIGALKYCINALLTAYPHLRIYIVAPAFRNDAGNTENDKHLNKTLAQYSSEIENISHKLSFPCLNLYSDGMVNNYNKSFILADGVHRTIKGYELLARQFCNLIKK